MKNWRAATGGAVVETARDVHTRLRTDMVWAGDNDPQEYDATPDSCGHDGIMYHIRDDDGAESISCISCITDEMETELKQGIPVVWTIVRLTDQPDERDWEETQPLETMPY